MRNRQTDQLLTVWAEAGILRPEQVSRLQARLASASVSLIHAVVEGGFFPEGRCLELVGEALEMPVLNLDGVQPEAEALRMLPAPLLRRQDVLPLFVLNKALTAAVADPFVAGLRETLRSAAGGREVSLVLASHTAIRKALDLFVPAASLAESAERLTVTAARAPAGGVSAWESLTADVKAGTREAPVVALVNQLFVDAVAQGASDIHLEPEQEKCIIRYRVDGVLRHIFDLPSQVQNGLISRIKVMAGLDIAQRMSPQDGKIHVAVANRELDLRVSTLPTVHGENVVLRLLDARSLKTDLATLGFVPEMLATLTGLIQRPYGIVLVTGPTGSGKTTTLYSALSSLDSDGLNIMTIEDPVEYRLAKIRQTQVNPSANLTFGAALRAILRQDPDVVLVGEIRDEETARIAVQSAMTGHLVFSTLHTNDAPSALGRLVEMKVPGYLVAATVLGILAQRLVRKICPHCGVKGPISPGALALVGGDWPADTPVMTAVGCQQCRYSGYVGRLGIYELLVPDGQTREAMANGADTGKLRELAQAGGMATLREDGLRKARALVTTVEEVLRVCM